MKNEPYYQIIDNKIMIKTLKRGNNYNCVISFKLYNVKKFIFGNNLFEIPKIIKTIKFKKNTKNTKHKKKSSKNKKSTKNKIKNIKNIKKFIKHKNNKKTVKTKQKKNTKLDPKDLQKHSNLNIKTI